MAHQDDTLEAPMQHIDMSREKCKRSTALLKSLEILIYANFTIGVKLNESKQIVQKVYLCRVRSWNCYTHLHQQTGSFIPLNYMYCGDPC